MKHRKFTNPEVENIFNTYPEPVRAKLLFIRELIFKISDETEEIGQIEEALKWDTPSYLTHTPKSGTTIRLSEVHACEEKYAISVHCQTSLVSEFKAIYPELEYDGNRSIIMDTNIDAPLETIEHFIVAALTYHHRKKLGAGI